MFPIRLDGAEEVIGRLEEAVLTVLRNAKGEPATTEIFQALANRLRKASLGAMYVTLDRLERKQLVTRRQGEPTAVRGGKARYYYRITNAGRMALAEVQNDTSEIDAVIVVAKG